MQESFFLAAFRADPADRLARLAYADWLEERDDPRAELIRVEEDMRLLPVFTDRFWELKPRRNELRAACSPEWLAEMGYGTVCEPVFRHGVPEGWKERWRLIREFTERWHGIPLPDVGGRQEEIRAAEARLGRTLSPSVQEYVAFAHDMPQEDDYRDIIDGVYQMEEVQEAAALSLMSRGERGYLFAVCHSDLARDDPSVSGFEWEPENRNATFVADERNPIHASITSFVLRFAMGASYFSRLAAGGFAARIDEWETDELICRLEATYPTRTTFENKRIYEADNILICLQPAYLNLGQRITMHVFKPMLREAIPEFLWTLAHGRGTRRGMFELEAHRYSLTGRLLPVDSPEDDLPF